MAPNVVDAQSQPKMPVRVRPSLQEVWQPFEMLGSLAYESRRYARSQGSGIDHTLEEARALLVDAGQATAPYLRLASADEAVNCMTRLHICHYPDFTHLDESLAKLRAEDWISDLAGQPIGLLVECSRAWRMSSAKHAPTAGQLLRCGGVVGPRWHYDHVRESLMTVRDLVEATRVTG